MEENNTATMESASTSSDFWNSPVVVQDVKSDGSNSVTTPTPEPAPQPASAPASPAQLATPAAPATPAAAPDPLLKVFGDGNNLDGDNFLKFVNAPTNYTPDDSPLPGMGAPSAPAAVATPAAPELPPWKKDLEEERAFEKNISQNLNLPLQLLQQAMQQPGANLATAYQQVRQQLAEHQAEFIQQWKYERRESSSKAEYEKSQARAEEALLQPKAAQNLMKLGQDLVSKGYKGSPQEAIDHLLYDPKFGGQDLRRIMNMQNPGLSKETPAKQAELSNAWFTKFASNSNNIAWLSEIATLRAMKASMPYIIKQTRGNNAASIKNRQEAQMPKPTPTTPAARPALAENDPEKWFQERPKAFV